MVQIIKEVQKTTVGPSFGTSQITHRVKSCIQSAAGIIRNYNNYLHTNNIYFYFHAINICVKNTAIMRSA